ncbi:hypothetical protein BJX76DRAFT_73403 [Aspergillus varians]
MIIRKEQPLSLSIYFLSLFVATTNKVYKRVYKRMTKILDKESHITDSPESHPPGKQMVDPSSQSLFLAVSKAKPETPRIPLGMHAAAAPRKYIEGKEGGVALIVTPPCIRRQWGV